MYEEPESIDSTIRRKARNIASVVAAVMLVAPFMISIYSWDLTTEVQLSGVLWNIWLQGGWPMPPFYMLYSAIMSLPMHIPKFAFVYMIYRYYMGKTTRNRAIIVGLISEIWWWIPNLIIMMMIMMTSPYGYYSLILPIPILFLFGIIIMLKIPAPDIETPWKDFKEKADWWEKPPEKEEKVEREEPPKKEKKAKKEEPSPPPDDEPW